jgi:hypothetical protein
VSEADASPSLSAQFSGIGAETGRDGLEQQSLVEHFKVARAHALKSNRTSVALIDGLVKPLGLMPEHNEVDEERVPFDLRRRVQTAPVVADLVGILTSSVAVPAESDVNERALAAECTLPCVFALRGGFAGDSDASAAAHGSLVSSASAVRLESTGVGGVQP